ncbi:hypothetical protein [Candidatus Thalassolituus haligoni]|uniref:hypothetical protein n=1 Tax=Candidatus Thalassolituus haligoni TaxID=3100113 RepID=UPI003517D7EE|tara:strand:+ start:9848 stop:10087 length:240 start_codon:yes stop_codon:yes gene_type:complete
MRKRLFIIAIIIALHPSSVLPVQLCEVIQSIPNIWLAGVWWLPLQSCVYSHSFGEGLSGEASSFGFVHIFQTPAEIFQG